MKYYALVIDTDQYSGNFEREMATYCTDLEFPRGGQFRTEEVVNATWWSDHTYPHYNGEWDEGVCIWITPGWSNNGSGQHTRLADGENVKWPAYQSVAIFCDEVPPQEVIEEVRQRAVEFCKLFALRRKTVINVEKMRLVTIEQVTDETEIEV